MFRVFAWYLQADEDVPIWVFGWQEAGRAGRPLGGRSSLKGVPPFFDCEP